MDILDVITIIDIQMTMKFIYIWGMHFSWWGDSGVQSSIDDVLSIFVLKKFLLT